MFQLQPYAVAISLAFICAMPAHSASIGALGDSNPFMEKTTTNPHLEPTGRVMYAFSQQPSHITNIDRDRLYIKEAQDTQQQGFTLSSQQRIADINHEIQHYQSFEQELALNVRQRNQLSLLSGNSTLMNPAQMALQLHPDAEQHLGKIRVLNHFGSGNYLPHQGWDSVVRIVKSQYFGNMIIQAWDFSLSGGGAILDADAVNIHINDAPGILIVRVSPEDNRAQSIISWVSDTRSYTIQVDQNIVQANTKDRLLAYCAQLSLPN